MKKKVSVLLLVIIVFFVVGSASNLTYSTTTIKAVENADSQNRTSNLCFVDLKLEADGSYHMNGFGDDFFIYKFDETDVVVYHIFGDTFIIGENTLETGTSYSSITVSSYPFLAFSDKYFLFLTDEGKIAYELKETILELEDGTHRLYHKKHRYEDLSDEEKNAFYYPSSYEKFIKPI